MAWIVGSNPDRLEEAARQIAPLTARLKELSESLNALLRQAARDSNSAVYHKMIALMPSLTMRVSKAVDAGTTLEQQALLQRKKSGAQKGVSAADRAKQLAQRQERAEQVLATQRQAWTKMKPGENGRYLGILPGERVTDKQAQERRHFVVYANEVKVGGSAAWRNNNPGNLTGGGAVSQQLGAIGHDRTFAIFRTMADGQAAQRSHIMSKWGNHTIARMMEEYAPRVENNTDKYIRTLGQWTGIDVNGPRVNQMTRQQFDSLIQAMHRYEGLAAGTVVPR